MNQLGYYRGFKKRRSDQNEVALREIRNRRTALGKKSRQKKRPPGWLHPRSIERLYNKILLEWVEVVEEIINSMVLPHLKSLTDERDENLPPDARQDGYADNATRLVDNMSLGVQGIPFNAEFVAADIGQKVSEWNDQQWRKIMKSVVGVELLQQEPYLNDMLKGFTAENTALMKNVSQTLQEQVGTTVQRGLRNGDRWNSIAFEIVGDNKTFKELQVREQQFLDKGVRTAKGASIIEKTKNRTKLIARDQVSKLNGQLSQVRQTSIGVEEYIWRTSRDERVRPSHRRNEGKRFKWNEPPPTGHPGTAVQCRCTAEPVLEPILEQV
jgi:SPP1 gp7 family putative phage head morphogenesis protein